MKKPTGCFVLIFFIMILLIAHMIIVEKTSDTITVTVNDKERVTTGSGKNISSKYLIYTDKEVFECTDEFVVGKFNSSDIYGVLVRGKKYKFTVYGIRYPLFSMYRNITKVEECNTD